ncbi:MAG TPA: hypothetical protein VG125_07855 [Pirellulales bacterium]|jgi:hypothetical protein|nr:hypothetical protein [Pirellulales bacterium]
MHGDSTEFPSGKPSPAGCAPPGARDLARFLYNHNPFYVMSAALVLYGLRLSFLGGDAFQTRAMIIGLMAFALLLASTAWLIIRLGNVWNDARTILLIIVLLFVAISVSGDLSLARFDALGLLDFRPGFESFLGGYVFALIVSEGLLLTLGIGLRFWYRLSYHLFLGLFFLYPLAILPLLTESWDRFLPWALFGFSLAAGVALLPLLPAVRRGSDYIKRNGTPWRWPYFPWSLFVILGVAAALRHYYLCLSFHAVPGLESLFRPYFLVPPLVAVNLLLMEAALVSGRRSTRVASLAMPLMLVPLAAWKPAPTFWQEEFLKDFVKVVGAEPLFVTLVVCVAIYALATVRRLPGAADFLTLSVAGLAVVRPEAHLVDLLDPDPLPILICGLIQLPAAFLYRSSPRLFAASTLVLAALTVEYQESWVFGQLGVVPWHLLLAIILVVGSLPDDRFARRLQHVGAVLLIACAAGWAAWLAGPAARVTEPSWGTLPAYAYPVAAAALAVCYGRFVRNRVYLVAAAVDLVLWSVVAGDRVYSLLRTLLAGLDYLLLGALSFAVAALISLMKTGLPQRLWSRYKLVMARMIWGG